MTSDPEPIVQPRQDDFHNLLADVAALSLPARGYSALLREWTASGATDESSRQRQPVLERILGLSLSLQAVEPAVVEAAGEVMSF